MMTRLVTALIVMMTRLVTALIVFIYVCCIINEHKTLQKDAAMQVGSVNIW